MSLFFFIISVELNDKLSGFAANLKSENISKTYFPGSRALYNKITLFESRLAFYTGLPVR
jgi:hypothetical protein